MIFQSFLISLMSNLVAQEFPNHSYRFQKYDLAQKLHCSQKRKIRCSSTLSFFKPLSSGVGIAERELLWQKSMTS